MRESEADEDERTRLIRELLPLVRTLARRIARMIPHVELDDLIGDGCVGAVRAVDTFDPARGVPLRGYARCVIAGAILNGVRSVDPVSERARRTLRNADRLRLELAQVRGELPSQRELEEFDPRLGPARAAALLRVPLSLDTVLAEREGYEADASADPAHIVVARERARDVSAACEQLPARLRELIRKRYWSEVPLRTLSRELAVTPQRVSQLHLAALARLRAALPPP